jgi:hypothetical protein
LNEFINGIIKSVAAPTLLFHPLPIVLDPQVNGNPVIVATPTAPLTSTLVKLTLTVTTLPIFVYVPVAVGGTVGGVVPAVSVAVHVPSS